MAKAPLSKHETIFDDLLAETNLILSNDDRMEELSPAQREALAKVEQPTDLEIGRPVAVILFWHTFHCVRCNSSTSAPKYGTGAMLKRWFARRRLFQYESLVEHKGLSYDALTHRVEMSHSDITCCEHCFNKTPEQLSIGSYTCPRCLSATVEPNGVCPICT